MPLQDFSQQGSRSPPFSSPAETQQPRSGRTELLGTLCMTIILSTSCLSNSRKKSQKHSPPPKELSYAIVSISSARWRKQQLLINVKKSEARQEDLQHNRYYCRLLNSRHWLPTIKQNYPGRKPKIAVTTGSMYIYISQYKNNMYVWRFSFFFFNLGENKLYFFDVWILLKKWGKLNFVGFFPPLKTCSFWKRTDKTENVLNAEQESHPSDISSFIVVLPLVIKY